MSHGCTRPARQSTSSTFFFTATPTTEISTLSLHDALPIWPGPGTGVHSRQRDVLELPARGRLRAAAHRWCPPRSDPPLACRSEEHTSELQSRPHLVCRLLLEKKNKSKRFFLAAHLH